MASKKPETPAPAPTSEQRAKAQKTEVHYTVKCGLCDTTEVLKGHKELREKQVCKGTEKKPHAGRYRPIVTSRAVKVAA